MIVVESAKLKKLKETIEELRTIKQVINENPKKTFITSKPYLFTLQNGRTIPREQLLKNNLDGSAVMIAAMIDKLWKT